LGEAQLRDVNGGGANCRAMNVVDEAVGPASNKMTGLLPVRQSRSPLGFIEWSSLGIYGRFDLSGYPNEISFRSFSVLLSSVPLSSALLPSFSPSPAP
jgi:hypothetical protein